jgi:S-formylglutathione hydrolase FrmB
LFSAARLLAVSILAGVAAVLLFASPAAAQKLVTIDASSSYVDPSNQNLAGPVTPNMGPHPGTLKANVLLPDGYTPKKRYPLLLLFHGSGERFDSWADPLLGEIRNTAKGLDAVIVMPEGAQGFYTDWWNDGERKDPAWEDYIRESLLPEVQKRFSIRPERRYHAVAGFSMGGYGTWLTASQLPGFFGTAIPLSAFASIRTPASVSAFSLASGGTGYDTIYGPSTGFYAEGHDPVALGANYRYTNLDVYTGDGQPDPARRPQNDPLNPGYATDGDFVSLLLEGVLKTQNDDAVAAAEAAGNPNVDYTAHKGSHDWEFWHPDLKSAIARGLFRPAPQQPAKWTYRTAATEGQAWDIAFNFSPPPTAVTTFTRSGRTLKVTGEGELTIFDGNGCSFTSEMPFTRTLPAKPCRSLKLKAVGKKLRKNRKGTVTVTVRGMNSAGVTAPVDAARVTVGGKTALTSYNGKATLKVRLKKAGKLTVKAGKKGFRPAKRKLRVRR